MENIVSLKNKCWNETIVNLYLNCEIFIEIFFHLSMQEAVVFGKTNVGTFCAIWKSFGLSRQIGVSNTFHVVTQWHTGIGWLQTKQPILP